MWFSFWRSRDRFSVDELRYLTEQLMKVQIVNDVNKDFVIEALRSIAELITYGDQNDPAFFDFFMEKQVMGEFVRILKVSRTLIVSLQLLQTMSIMIQNLKNEHSIYYLFSNEHINFLITFSFDFHNEELLSYYISFLRAISGKLNKNTISLLVQSQNDEVISFPLYVEGIKFALHEEGMIRTAVRALTLNVYHVGDQAVNSYIASAPHSNYFSNLVKYFREQWINLSQLVLNNANNSSSASTSSILSAVDEIEDSLYYFSDVISAGIPDVGRLLTDNILSLLVFPLVLPSLRRETVNNEKEIGIACSLYLLCCILRIVKIKDLANTIVAALMFCVETFTPRSQPKLNGCSPFHSFTDECQGAKDVKSASESKDKNSRMGFENSSSSSLCRPEETTIHSYRGSHFTVREALLSFIKSGDDIQVLGSLLVLATFLETKELNESMLDALGILPQRKQHKKLLLQALVGEGSAEAQLFSSENGGLKDGIGSELESFIEKLQVEFGITCAWPEVGSLRGHRSQVLEALVVLFCRSNISTETLWVGGWLLRQLLPYSEAEYESYHLKLLGASFQKSCGRILEEAKGTWADMLIAILCDEWRKCKRAIEASSPGKDPKCMLLPSKNSISEGSVFEDSSFSAGERMCESVKVFVLLHQLHILSLGNVLPDQPTVHPPVDVLESSRAVKARIDILGPKPSSEMNLVDAVPCRIAFERGKERHFRLVAVSAGVSGWIILAEELPLKPCFGIVRVVAPLAGCSPRIDDKHSRWLHLRIRPFVFPFLDSSPKYGGGVGKAKTKALIDGRWTLAFRDESTCQSALSMILEEINLQKDEVERRLKPLLSLEIIEDVDPPSCTLPPLEEATLPRTLSF